MIEYYQIKSGYKSELVRMINDELRFHYKSKNSRENQKGIIRINYDWESNHVLNEVMAELVIRIISNRIKGVEIDRTMSESELIDIW